MLKIINPFYVYIVTFATVLSIAAIPWSKYSREVSIALYLFFIVTFFISFLFGYILKKKKLFEYYDIHSKYKSRENLIILFIILLYLIEAIYSKGFPLFGVVGISNITYQDFGIPLLHVFTVTFHSFYITYYLHKLLSNFNKIGLFKLVLLFVPIILMLNRSILMMVFFSSIVLISMKFIKNINFKSFKLSAKIIIVTLLVLYAFGVLGNLRSNSFLEGKEKAFNSDYIMIIGDATNEFKDSNIPKPFFWSYLYVASPIYNLQLNIDTIRYDYSIKNLIVGSFLPDFVNNRIEDVSHIDLNEILLISPGLTVATVFGQTYADFGWLGMSLFISFIFIFIAIYLVILKQLNPRFFVTGLVLTCTMMCFFLFYNMWEYSAFSFQLIYPIILVFLKNKNI